MTYGIQAEALVKRFGDTTALAGVDIAARVGTVLGVLGPNGAGKTTMIRILATLIRLDQGHAEVAGFDVVTQVNSVRRVIGLTGQFATVDDDLTGAENLIMLGELLDLRRSEAKVRAAGLLADFELSDVADRRVATYSGGMRRRLDLAASLVGRPEVVFLDEPTTGLDPVKREEAWRLIRRLADGGTTILLTTQYLDEAEALAGDVAVIDHGRVVAHGTPGELKQIVGLQTIAVRPRDPVRMGDTARILAAVARREPTSPSPGVLAVAVDGEDSFTEAVRRLETAGIGVIELSLHLPSLDEVFFSLTGHSPKAGRRGGGRRPHRTGDENVHKRHSGGVVTDTFHETVASTRGRPASRRPFPLVRHSLVLARRVLVKIRRTPEGLADAIVLPVIFLAMFVFLFGGAVAGSTSEYLQAIFPAAVVMTVIIAGVMASGLNLNADIKRGIVDRFRSLPIGRAAPLIGSVLGDMVRYFVSLAMLFAFGTMLGFRATTDPLSVVAAVVLTIVFAFCLSWGYVLVGILVREPSAVQGMAIVSLFPLAFGTNMVAPTATVPGWLQAWVKVNPVTHAMDACRGLMIGGPAARPVLITLLWSAALLIVFAPMAVHAYRRRT